MTGRVSEEKHRRTIQKTEKLNFLIPAAAILSLQHTVKPSLYLVLKMRSVSGYVVWIRILPFFFFFLHLVLLMCSCFPPRDWISGFPSKICMWVIWVGSKSAPDFPQSSVSCWVKGKLCTLCETLFDYKFLITFSLFFPVIPLSSP